MMKAEPCSKQSQVGAWVRCSYSQSLRYITNLRWQCSFPVYFRFIFCTVEEVEMCHASLKTSNTNIKQELNSYNGIGNPSWPHLLARGLIGSFVVVCGPLVYCWWNHFSSRQSCFFYCIMVLLILNETFPIIWYCVNHKGMFVTQYHYCVTI